ncbi:MAG: hypothetical protein ACTSX9_09730 [Candidatus Njordarchaeales archaeon]
MVTRRLEFDKIDLLLIVLCIVTFVIAYHKWATYELPVGYDTPAYLARAKKFFSQGISSPRYLIFSRLPYYYLLGALIRLFGGNDLLVGKILWLQGILIIIANYLLVKYLTHSRTAAFFSCMFWIFWIRTARLLTDLHANTFGIFLILLSQFFLIRLLEESKRIWIFSLILSWVLLGFIHQLSFYVFSASVISYIVLCAVFNSTSRQLFKYFKHHAVRYSAIILPGVIFVLAVMLYKASLIGKFSDMLRWWWPEAPIYDFMRFVNCLGGLQIFLLSELGLLYVILFEKNNPVFRYFFVYMLVGLFSFQNNILGLHALPERFAVFTFLPIYSSLSLMLFSRFFVQKLKKNLRIIFSSHQGRRFMLKLDSKSVQLLTIALLMLVILSSMIPSHSLYVSKRKSTIDISEYQCLKKVYEEYLSKKEYVNESILIVVGRPAMVNWLLQIPKKPNIVKIKSSVSPFNGVAATSIRVLNRLSLQEKIAYVMSWDEVYFINVDDENLSLTCNNIIQIDCEEEQKIDR